MLHPEEWDPADPCEERQRPRIEECVDGRIQLHDRARSPIWHAMEAYGTRPGGIKAQGNPEDYGNVGEGHHAMLSQRSRRTYPCCRIHNIQHSWPTRLYSKRYRPKVVLGYAARQGTATLHGLRVRAHK